MINRFKNQQGSALVIVLALVIIAGILGFAAMSVAENQTLMVNRHQEREQALHYAEAGLHRYMAELNNNLGFFDTQNSIDMQSTNIAFEEGLFRLKVTKPTTSDPHLIISSTGWQKDSDIKRTIEVKLSKKTPLSNIIIANVGENRIEYFNRFLRGDVINGPLHINGNLITNGRTGDGYDGPIFNGKVTYSGEWIEETLPSGVTDTTKFMQGEPERVERMGMPAIGNNVEAKTDPGYVYEGRTCIHIIGNQLKIRNQLKSTETKPLPPNGIVYVKGGLGDKWALNTANVFVSGQLDGRLTIVAEKDIYITASDPTDWDRPQGSVTDPRAKSGSGGITYAGLNMTNVTDAASLAQKLANCDDMLGLIANKNVEILHSNWPKQSSGSPAYYWDGWGWYGLGWGLYSDVSPHNMNIHASILAVTGSFKYEKYLEDSAKGDLTVVGSINQYTIGPVAGFGLNILDLGKYDVFHSRISGYGKNYWHDPRLMYDSPPGYLEAAGNGWEIIEWQEVSNPVAAGS